MVMYPILDIVEATAGDFPLGKPLGPGVVEDVLAVDWYGVGNILERTVNNGTDPNVAAWTDEGGPAAMDYCDGVLIVTQTPEGQERIIDFLTMLRKAKAQAGSSEPVRMAETAGAKHIRRRLAERIDVDFENAKLLGVLDFLREALKDVNLVVAPDLDKEGIDLTLRDATLKQKQAPIGEILATVLGLDLGYQIRPHYVFISTRYRLRELETVMYPIRDILTETKVDSPVECVPLRSAERVVDVHDTSGVQWDDSSRGAPARAGVGNIFGGREEFRGRGEENELAIGWQEVADIIKRTVSGMTDPKVAAWTDEGGPAAIDYYDGVLIVTQTPQAHERIAEFFALLREGLARVERQLQE